MIPDGAAESTPVVWFAASSGDAAPSVDARRALDRWAARKGISLADPQGARAPARMIAWEASEEVERALAMAREALVALEPGATELALARAEATLRDAPELPHAAWLMAEVQRGWAARFTRIEPRDPERAARAWQRAAALDGGRVAGVGEVAIDGREPGATVTIEIENENENENAGGRDTLVHRKLRVDGIVEARASVERSAGEHHVAVTRDGEVAWAGWLTFAPGAVLRVALPPAPACSSGDLARAVITRDPRTAAASVVVVNAAHVRCPRWLAAMASRDPGQTRVASCSGAQCGPFAPLPTELGLTRASTPGEGSTATRRWPAWVPWTIAGVGIAAVATTATVLVATGALRDPPAETRFVGGGLRITALGLPF